MSALVQQSNPSDLRGARRDLRGLVSAAVLFGLFVNLLMLTGPLYMLQIYDRVLGSGSVETLVALTGIAAFLYLMMWALDAVRSRIMARVAAQFSSSVEPRVFQVMLARAEVGQGDPASDLRAIHAAMASPGAMALFDIPFAPLFIAGIWIFHPSLGLLALGGGAFLIAMAIANQVIVRPTSAAAAGANHQADAFAARIITAADTVRSGGMAEHALARWQDQRRTAMQSHLATTDAGGVFATGTKAFRLFLQSAMLGLAAYLVLRGQLTPGAMIAASILMGRALAPIELAVAHWPLFQRARVGWRTLDAALRHIAPERKRTPLPRPKAQLELRRIAVIPPGERCPALQDISFTLSPGQALGIIGSSGAGKSTLARALTGLWPVAAGDIRLGGAALGQYGPAALARHVGYLPQRVHLFAGTIAENIARLDPAPDAKAVITAARRAGAHEMILALPQGYDTLLGCDGAPLSGGQMQRIGLAQALYGDPVLVILDEPNSNLDNEGSDAVNLAIRSIKETGGAVIIVAHRPAAIAECDLLLMLEAGRQRSFGAKGDVLSEVVRNHTQIVAATGGRGQT
ncbi:type I secretion system permease/ATPase [Roseovarius nanhaiticus]|uniref:type I secretion system permease/ATPase n=1 Tax=Roseovarius nanhaiticus TaxID=573024 RepID=UPI002492BF2A|nr:type I secretion system permease/ATPase [Roseovarius nanhaiticus]